MNRSTIGPDQRDEREEEPVEEVHLTLESLARWMPDDCEPDPLVQVAVHHLVERCPICRQVYEEFLQLMGTPASPAPAGRSLVH
jgi:hypothetical protein